MFLTEQEKPLTKTKENKMISLTVLAITVVIEIALFNRGMAAGLF